MLDPDPESMNPDPKQSSQVDVIESIHQEKKFFSVGKAEGVRRQRFSRRRQQQRPQVLHARLPQAGLRRREAPAGAGQGPEGGSGGRRRYTPQKGSGAGRRWAGRR